MSGQVTDRGVYVPKKKGQNRRRDNTVLDFIMTLHHTQGVLPNLPIEISPKVLWVVLDVFL